MQIHIPVTCPLETLEGVTVIFNMMANNKQLDTLQRTLGREREDIIVSVEGWPEEYGTEPFGEESPIAFRAWAVKDGFTEALRKFVTDPN